VEAGGIAPLVGQVERQLHLLATLAHVLRGEEDVPVVAMATAAGRLEIVLLPARHVEDDRRELGERDLRERLLHQRESLTGRSRRRARTRRKRAPRHADGL